MISGSRGGRVALTLLWAVLALCLGAQILRMKIAEAGVRAGDGATASRVRPQNGHALALLAEQQLQQGHLQQAQRTSMLALDRTPLTQTGARTLAMAYEKLGNTASAEAAWQAGSRLGWRDGQTQLWAILRALANRQTDIAALRADALLRTNSSDQSVSVVRRFLVIPAVRHAFVERIRVNPPWRARFFHWDAPLSPTEINVMVAVLRELGTAGSIPSRSDLRDTITALIAAHQASEAIELDRRFVRRVPDSGSVMDDGGLQFATDDYRRNVTPFDWSLVTDQATMDETGGQRSILATASGTLTAQKYVAIRPGEYFVAYDVWGDRQAPATIGVKVVCNRYDRVLGESDRQPLTTDKPVVRRFPIKVTADCPLIRIMVGQFWPGSDVNLQFDNVKIIPGT